MDVAGARLDVGVTGEGPDVVVLSGGPGCVHYLEDDAIAPRGVRAWYPEPRGVGRSTGGPHDLERAVADLEAVREAVGVGAWVVLGHSWGADLGVRYALDHPERVRAVVGVAGTGPQRDRSWAEAYDAGKDAEPHPEIAWDRGVHAALMASFRDWIREPRLWRSLADLAVPVHLVAAGDDIRPSWPLEQLAALVPDGRFTTVPGVPHDFWWTHPEVWLRVVTDVCGEALSRTSRPGSSSPAPGTPTA